MSHPLLKLWQRCAGKPGGKWLFSKLLGFKVPYTGSISPQIVRLEPGYAEVVLSDRRAVRNHLNSIHAIALMNLAEVCSGLAMLCGTGSHTRGILTGLSMDYLKKARGTLIAKCRCEVPQVKSREEYLVISEIQDANGDVVARATAKWLLEPNPKKQQAA